VGSENSIRQARRDLVCVLKRKRIVTIDELMEVLKTDVRMTVFRALKDVPYQTSYSHGGRYYALKTVMRFDEHGLWSVQSVWFSRFGTLMATLEQSIEQSDRGYFSGELESLLHVGTKESLLRLLQQGRVSRERILRAYLYCSKDAVIRKRQIAMRAAQMGVVLQPLVAPSEIADEVKAAIVLFSALLDERLRRLFAGIEALQFGRGAEGWVADLLGIHRQTVAKGRQQLLDGDVLVDRIRKRGAGRPRVEKKARQSSKKSSS
jgi:hypothetical protein